MKSYIVLGCLLVSLAYVMGGETELTKDASIDKYREMLNSFQENVKRFYRALHDKPYSDKQFVNNKLEGSMAAVRTKRETEQTSDFQTQLTGALQNVQKMFDDVKNSDGAKDFLAKVNEFGSNLQTAGQQFGVKVQETLSQFSKGQQQPAS